MNAPLTLTAAPEPVRTNGGTRLRRLRRLRLAAWVVLTLVAACAGVTILWPGGRDLSESVLSLRRGWAWASLLPLAAWVLLATTPRDAVRVSDRTGRRLVLLTGAALAASGLWLATPTLAPDVLRYYADGATWLTGRSAYAVTPGDALVATSVVVGDDPQAGLLNVLHAHVPSRDVTSLAPPVIQAASAAAAAIELVLPGGSVSQFDAAEVGWRQATLELPWWRRLFVWRALLAAAYLITVAEIVLWMRQRGVSVWWACLYAWSPVAWLNTAVLGVPGVLGALFLVATLRRIDAGRVRRSGIAAAFAVASQPALLPVVWAASARTPWRAVVWACGLSALLWSPILLSPSAASGLSTATVEYLSRPGDAVVGRIFSVWPPAGWIVWAVCVSVAAVRVRKASAGAAAAAYVVSLVAMLAAPTSAVGLNAAVLAVAAGVAARAGLAALVGAGLTGLALSPADATPALITWAWVVTSAVALAEWAAYRTRTRSTRRSSQPARPTTSSSVAAT